MSANERYQRPPLRYQRFGGGYRREDVEFALAELRLTLRQLDNDLELLRDRNRDLELELQTARNEIEGLRGKEHELSQTIAAALNRASDIEEGANARAREITAQAEEAAMRIRSEASRRIEDSSEQFNEMLRLKDNLLDAMRSVVSDFDQAISRVERGEQLFPGVAQAVPGEWPSQTDAASEMPAVLVSPPEPVEPDPEPIPEPAAEAASAPVFVPPPVPVPEPEPVAPPQTPPVSEIQPAAADLPMAIPVTPQPPPAPPVPDAVSIPAAPPPPPGITPEPVSAAPAEPPAAPAPEPPAAQAPPPPAPVPAEPERSETFDTRVELDAGPFADFAALSAFERALAHLPKVEDVYVRRLADDRALIELTLSEPAPLLDTMRASLPYSLDVRSASHNKIVVNVAVQQPAGTR